jgi:hypothetical protein
MKAQAVQNTQKGANTKLRKATAMKVLMVAGTLFHRPTPPSIGAAARSHRRGVNTAAGFAFGYVVLQVEPD